MLNAERAPFAAFQRDRDDRGRLRARVEWNERLPLRQEERREIDAVWVVDHVAVGAVGAEVEMGEFPDVAQIDGTLDAVAAHDDAAAVELFHLHERVDYQGEHVLFAREVEELPPDARQRDGLDSAADGGLELF